MAYLGYEPSKVAVTVGQGVIDATHIQDASITTADLGNDSVTPIKIDDDGTGFQMGSLGLGTAVSGSEKLTVGGTASFSSDVTISNKLVHSGDTDTYLSFGTDSLSLYTGGTNVIDFIYGAVYIKQNNKPLVGYNTGGSARELIKIDGSNVVQIAESSDSNFGGGATFAGDVNVTADGARFFVSSADYELISIGRAGSSGSALDQGYIRMKSSGTNKIAFHTAGNSYINGGSLGIGTDNPQKILHLENSSPYTYYKDTDDNKVWVTGVGASRYNIYEDNTNLRFTVEAGGNVGIGMDNPSSPLTVKTASYSSNIAEFTNPSNTTLVGAYCTGNPGSGQFYVKDAGGTTKVLLNSIGNSYFNGGFVGIGASPNALLDINKSTTSTDLPSANESFEGYRLILANPQLTNNATNALGFSMYNGEVCAYIATQTYYNGQYETDMIFGTRDDNRDDGIDDTVGDGLKEAFRIDHDSNIQFHGNMFGGGSKDAAPWNDSSGNGHLYYQKGTSALGATLALSTNVDVGGGYAGMYINLVNASASGDRMIAFGMDGNSAGQIHYSSSNQVAYATSGSDKRLKKNITNWIGDTLSTFANIEPKMFHWKTQDSSEDKIKGFIAQDMIENFPEAYPLGKMGEGDDQVEMYQYNPSGMVIYLMKALKEQVAVNADLTSRIEALENA